MTHSPFTVVHFRFTFFPAGSPDAPAFTSAPTIGFSYFNSRRTGASGLSAACNVSADGVWTDCEQEHAMRRRKAGKISFFTAATLVHHSRACKHQRLRSWGSKIFESLGSIFAL